jgi:hypothetical protein
VLGVEVSYFFEALQSAAATLSPAQRMLAYLGCDYLNRASINPVWTGRLAKRGNTPGGAVVYSQPDSRWCRYGPDPARFSRTGNEGGESIAPPMATHERRGEARRNTDRIPTTVVFGEPSGIPGTLTVGAERGDIVVDVDVAEHSCTLVLTIDDALTLGMWLSAHIVDERRRWSAADGSGVTWATQQTLRQVADPNGTAGTRDTVRGEGVAGLARLPQDRTERSGIIMTLILVAIGNFASAVLAAMLVDRI